MPTETVYGVAADPWVAGALENLCRVKGRSWDKPIARLAKDIDQVRRDGALLDKRALALAERYWPGSLTLVLENKPGFTGYRVPDHAVPLEIVAACEHPIALTSANLSGQIAPSKTREIDPALASQVDLILDSGSTRSQTPSTVVKILPNELELLREGAVSFPEVEKIWREAL